jgi:hypothetical protein
MALTPFRWVALAAIGCMLGLLAVVSLVPDPTRQIFRGPAANAPLDTTDARLSEVAGGLNKISQNLAARYRVIFVMDSAQRVAARAPDTGVARVFLSSEYSPSMRAAIERTIRGALAARSGNAARVDVFVISDTAQLIRGVLRYSYGAEVRYEIPRSAGERCRVFVRTGHPSSSIQAFNSEKATQQLLGACGYFLAFGEPGPMVRQWLLGNGWQYAVEGSWTKASLIPALQEDPSIFKGPSRAIAMLNVNYGGPECIKGKLAVCEKAVTTGAPRRRALSVGGATYALSLGTRRFYDGALGYQAGELLADAVREVGRDRFKAFWTSSDSVPAAFEKATGERWGAFIRQWMIAHYGEIEPGPRMSPFATVTSTILVIIALGATMLMSVKRTYV